MKDFMVSDYANYVIRVDESIPALRIFFIGSNKWIETYKYLLRLEKERLNLIIDNLDFIAKVINMSDKALLFLNIIDTRKICLKYYDPEGCPKCPIAKAGYPECTNSPIEKAIQIENQIFGRLTSSNYKNLVVALKEYKAFIEQMLKKY